MRVTQPENAVYPLPLAPAAFSLSGFLLTASTRRSIPLLARSTFSRPCCLVPDRARIPLEPLALVVTAVTPAGSLAQSMEKNERQQRLRWWSFKAVAAKQEDSGREGAGSGALLNQDLIAFVPAKKKWSRVSGSRIQMPLREIDTQVLQLLGFFLLIRLS